MKVFTITKENIKDIYGRLHKFFYNKNKTGFIVWHNFDCGFKKRIRPVICLSCPNSKGVFKYRTMIKYPAPTMLQLVENERIRLLITTGESDSLKIGDKIAFCSNRIIYRTECTWDKKRHKYIYSVFQVCSDKEFNSKKYPFSS